MPLYHFAHGDASEQVAALEESGEKVLSIAADDSGVYVVTESKAARRGKASETRAAQ